MKESELTRHRRRIRAMLRSPSYNKQVCFVWVSGLTDSDLLTLRAAICEVRRQRLTLQRMLPDDMKNSPRRVVGPFQADALEGGRGALTISKSGGQKNGSPFTY